MTDPQRTVCPRTGHLSNYWTVVRRRTGKVRQLRTSVLPLCYADKFRFILLINSERRGEIIKTVLCCVVYSTLIVLSYMQLYERVFSVFLTRASLFLMGLVILCFCVLFGSCLVTVPAPAIAWKGKTRSRNGIQDIIPRTKSPPDRIPL